MFANQPCDHGFQVVDAPVKSLELDVDMPNVLVEVVVTFCFSPIFHALIAQGLRAVRSVEMREAQKIQVRKASCLYIDCHPGVAGERLAGREEFVAVIWLFPIGKYVDAIVLFAYNPRP